MSPVGIAPILFAIVGAGKKVLVLGQEPNMTVESSSEAIIMRGRCPPMQVQSLIGLSPSPASIMPEGQLVVANTGGAHKRMKKNKKNRIIIV